MDISIAKEMKEKILSIMRENNTDTLRFERKYLPELIDKSLLRFDLSIDGLPIFKSSFKSFLNQYNINVKYEGNLIYFFFFKKRIAKKERIMEAKERQKNKIKQFLDDIVDPKFSVENASKEEGFPVVPIPTPSPALTNARGTDFDTIVSAAISKMSAMELGNMIGQLRTKLSKENPLNPILFELSMESGRLNALGNNPLNEKNLHTLIDKINKWKE